jgi:hypothetical protein
MTNSRFSETLPLGEGLVTLIAANKRARHPYELYSKRVEALRWFERRQPEAFDPYGMGWDRRAVGNSITSRIAQRLKSPGRLFSPRYPSYRGTVESKRSTLERYRFAICFENAHSISSYITEKIFDCFMAGCVPIYWGAPNVTDHIPADCFIDFRNFMDFGRVHDHIVQMEEGELLGYRDRIRSFPRSPGVRPYTTEYFSETISRRLIADA